MPATVPLSTPVTGITSARALAESAALAGPDTAVGPAIDRILLFLNGLSYEHLMHYTIEILDILQLLGQYRSALATAWLAGRAGEQDAVDYWANLNDLVLWELAA